MTLPILLPATMIPLAALDTLCEKSRRCVQRCENYKSELENKPSVKPDTSLHK